MGCTKTRGGRQRYCLSDFRNRIQIVKGSIVSTSGDYDVTNSETVLTCRAKVKTTGGSSFYNGVATERNNTHQFIVPYVRDIAIEKNYMILMNDEYYHINTILNENEDSLYWIITANKTGTVDQKTNWR